MGWAGLDNGALLDAAEAAFDAFITTDQNLRYQQRLTGRRLAILVLPTMSWPKIRARVPEVAAPALRPPGPDAFDKSWKPGDIERVKPTKHCTLVAAGFALRRD